MKLLKDKMLQESSQAGEDRKGLAGTEVRNRHVGWKEEAKQLPERKDSGESTENIVGAVKSTQRRSRMQVR